MIIYDAMEMKPQLEEILFLAKKDSITVERVTKKQLESQAHTKKHQGIIAVVPDPVYSTVDDIISFASKRSEPPLLVMLDGIQDPHNFGAISRSALAFGIDYIVIPKKRSVGITSGSIRASSGAIHSLNIIRVTNISNFINKLKKFDFWTVGLKSGAGRSIK
ncbi:MAG: 23S rRNA (guanosine(2251)-2'-O)-methyltransferase RlmB, partial [Chloroflexi bacterium]|nr:23S rRNA (guanosine(2251)-2'-O)-methyltransferase RlmB [Chloroflexota bacterium]